MYGWINGCLEDLVIKNYGEETWQLIKDVACIETPTTGEFFRSCYYSDDSTMKLVSTAAVILNKPVAELLEIFGHHFVHYLADHGYGRTLRCQGETFREWIRNVNEPHRLLRSRFPLSSFPEFWLEDMPSDFSGDSVILHYSSSRVGGLAPVVVGIIKEAAKSFFNLEIAMNDFEDQQCPVTRRYRGEWVLSGLNSEVPQLSKSVSFYSGDLQNDLTNYQPTQSTNIPESFSKEFLISVESDDHIDNAEDIQTRNNRDRIPDISNLECPFSYIRKPPQMPVDNAPATTGGADINTTGSFKAARNTRSSSLSSTSSDFPMMNTKFNLMSSGLSSPSACSESHKSVQTLESIGVNSTVLKRIFPFHIVVNKDLQVIQVGNKMKRFVQKQWKMNPMLQTFIGDHFQITLPNHFLWTWEGLQDLQHMSLEMTLTSTLVNTAGQPVDVKFRGEVVLMDKNGNCHPCDDDNTDDEGDDDDDSDEVFRNIDTMGEEDAAHNDVMSPFNSKPSSAKYSTKSDSTSIRRHCSFHNKKSQYPMTHQPNNTLPYCNAIFLINPDITNLDELLSLHLKLSDLPRHSFQADLLLIDEHLKTETSYAIKLQEISKSLDMESRKAKEALKMKRIFVRYVSHEIRTPLNIAILGLKCLEQELFQQQEESQHQTIKEYPVILTSNDDTHVEDTLKTRTFLSKKKSKMSFNELTTSAPEVKSEVQESMKNLPQISPSRNHLALLPTSSQRSMIDSPATTPRLSISSRAQSKNAHLTNEASTSNQVSNALALDDLHILTEDPDNFFATLDENDVYEEGDEEEEEEMERSLVETVLDEIKTSCTIAVDILNDLLLYEKIDNGMFDIAKQPTNLFEILDESAKLFRIQAKGADIHFITNDCKIIASPDKDPPFIYGFQLPCADGLCAGNIKNEHSTASYTSLSSISSERNKLGAKFSTRHHHHHHRQHHHAIKPSITISAALDRSKMQQVLRNLFTNAVKFTPSGGKVTLSYAIFGPEEILHEHFKNVPLQNLPSQQWASPMTHSASTPNNLSLFYSPCPSVTGTPASASSSSIMNCSGVSANSSSFAVQNSSKPSTPRARNKLGLLSRATSNYSHQNMNNYHGEKKIIFAENIENFGPCFARIAITDTGPGISASDQATLFHEFIQVKADKLQNGQGSGLGLWIAATIMKMHGGRIGVVSAGEGHGSVFLVDIPIDIIHDIPSCALSSSESSSSSFISFGSQLSSSSSVSTMSLTGVSMSSQSPAQLPVSRKQLCVSSSNPSPSPQTQPISEPEVHPSVDHHAHPHNPAKDVRNEDIASKNNKDQEDTLANFIIKEEALGNSFSALLVKVETEIERCQASPSVLKNKSMKLTGVSNAIGSLSENVCPTPTLSVTKRQNKKKSVSINNNDIHTSGMADPACENTSNLTSTTILPPREVSLEGKDFLLSLTPAERARFISLAPERLRAQHQPGIATLLQRSECFQLPSQSPPPPVPTSPFPSALKHNNIPNRAANIIIDDNNVSNNHNGNDVSKSAIAENMLRELRSDDDSGNQVTQLLQQIDRPIKTKPLSEARILIVDDAASNRKMVRRLLQRQFSRLEEAENGVVAIEKFAQSFVVNEDGSVDTSKAFDVILMDFMMPLMNGPDATKEIKRLAVEKFHHPVVVVGVTGNGLPEDIAMFIQHGADEVMVKPLDYEKLLKYLHNHPIFAE